VARRVERARLTLAVGFSPAAVGGTLRRLLSVGIEVPSA